MTLKEEQEDAYQRGKKMENVGDLAMALVMCDMRLAGSLRPPIKNQRERRRQEVRRDGLVQAYRERC